MSQGSNYKKEVMEALSNAPTNLITNKAFLWAASNLPDEGGTGTYKTKEDKSFNHDADDLFEAIGITEDDRESVIEEIKNIYISVIENNSDDEGFSCKKSMVIEKIIECNDIKVMKFFLAFGVMKHHNDLVEKSMEKLVQTGRGSKIEIKGDLDIPDNAPEELKEILKALIKLKNKLKGNSDKEDQE